MAEGSGTSERRPSLKPASFSRSTLSLTSGDDGSSRNSTNSGDSSPRQGSPITRRYKRKSSAGSTSAQSGTPSSTAGTFLSRFIGNFRSSGSLDAPRPHLARSLSTPGLHSDQRVQLPPAVPPIPGAFPPASSAGSPSGSTFDKFRPSFTRRATTTGSAPSPRGSPAHSPVLGVDIPRDSPGSPATLRGRERDPMEYAMPGARSGHAQSNSTDSRIESPGIRLMRRGSAVSQSTLQPEPGMRTPGLEAIEEPSAPSALERPLELIATLLPPALLLLSQLGPGHLFSPPLVHPLLSNSSDLTSSSESNAQTFSDRASISSAASSNATSSTFPLLPSTNHITHAYSHELHAPSTLSVPAVSAAAVWRLFRGFEWIGEVGGGAHLPGLREAVTETETDNEASTFDFPSLLQGVADALAADAGARGVELVIGQVGSGSAPSPVSTPDATEEVSPKEKVIESRELLVRGDERAWSVVLIWILHHIIASTVRGATVEVRFLATAIDSPLTDSSTDSSASDDAPTPTNAEKRWAISLEIVHTHAPSSSSAPSPSADLPSPPFATDFAHSLFVHLGLGVTSVNQADSRSWVLRTELPSCKPKPLADDPSSLLGRRRASLESSSGQEPTMNDLKRFAEVALKGQNVALHSGENSTFAKHLTTYLAGWGMDVSHVPLDSEEAASPESAWNKGRREPLGRLDSGFATEGNSPMSPFTDPHVSPLANLTAESVASSAASSETPSDLIIIDDDIATLRRILHSLRAAPVQYHASLMAKRPQLATRRTRSTPHVRQLNQVTHVTSASVIIHFASLTHYKAIKDIVQSTLASSKTQALPEVLVIPKPAGPRRIITALWTALKRPAVDPSLPPIATSPTSPGVQYWTPRLSPALAKEQEFDFHGSDTSANGREPTSSHSNKPRTPPAAFYGNPTVPAGHPPSPLGKISDDQASYFSVVAEGIDGTTPSEGMVIQSPDGRPAIFFQPQTRSSRVERAKDKAARIERSLSQRSQDGGDTSPPATRPPMATPHEIGLGAVRRLSSPSSSSSAEVVGTPALALDSFITAAKSRAVGEEPPEPEPAPIAPGPTLVRQQSSASIISRSSSAKVAGGSANTSPRVGASSPAFVARRMTGGTASTPPMSPSPNSPHLAGQATPATRQREASAPSSPPFLQSRRGTMSFGKKPRKPTRKPTIATVPPINVLIVEDNRINQTILSMFMKKNGIKYAVAKDGEEAVQKWKSGGFHLVLMDIQLPVKSGIEATREIREMERANNIGTFITTPTTDPSSPMSFGGSSSSSSASSAVSSVVNSPISPPLSMPVIIVALTASSLQVDRVSALAAGCNDFLTKPVSLHWLRQKLLEWGSMAYLSGFSLIRSDSPSSACAPSISSMHATPATHAGFTAGLNSKADVVSAHLHIDPRHGRASPSRAESPSRVGMPNQPSATVRAIEAAADANSDLNPPSSLALPSNPAVTISSPTPIVTPHAVPIPPAPTGPPASFDADLRTLATPPGASQPANLDAVDDRLESISNQRPGPSPLSNSTSVSDLHLESVVAEGARLADATRSRASSAGNSFSQIMHESGTVSSNNSPRDATTGFGVDRDGSETP